MNLREATNIVVNFVRERFGFALPTAGRRCQGGYLVEVLYEVLDDTPRLVFEVSNGEPKLVGSVGHYGSKHGRQMRKDG